jgi:hypothetical protein
MLVLLRPQMSDRAEAAAVVEEGEPQGVEDVVSGSLTLEELKEEEELPVSLPLLVSRMDTYLGICQDLLVLWKSSISEC